MTATTAPFEESATKAWRPLLRIGARTARRNPWRSLLVIALIAVPVAAAIIVAAGQRTLAPTAAQQQAWYAGRADTIVESYSPLGVAVDAGQRASIQGDYGLDPEQALGVDSFLDWTESATIEQFDEMVDQSFAPDTSLSFWTGGYQLGGDYVQVSSLDAADPLADGMVRLADGRFAEGPSEATISVPLAHRLGLGVGDHLELPEGDAVTLTGVHVDGPDAKRRSVLVPGHAPVPNATARVFLGGVADPYRSFEQLMRSLDQQGGPGTSDGARLLGSLQVSETAAMFGYDSNAPLQLDRPPVLSGVIATLLLVEVALIAAAAFSAGTRRRLREFGLLATIGADPGHVRRLVLAEAAVIGVAGSLGGVVLGMVGTELLSGSIARMASHAVTNVNARPSEMLAPAIVGVIAAIAAAWLPARTAARVAPLTALTGRMPLRPMKRRVVPAALALLVVGLVMAGTAAERSRTTFQVSDGQLVAIVFACMLCLVGAALGTSWVVERMAHHAEQLPLSLRLVARDAGRQRFRSSVTVAGLVVVLALPVVVAAVALTEHAKQDSTVNGLRDEIVLTDYSVDSGLEQLASTEADIATAVDVVGSGQIDVLGNRSDEWGISPAYISMNNTSGGSIGLGTDEAASALRLPERALAALRAGEAVAIGTGDTTGVYYSPDADLAGIPIDLVGVSERPATWTLPHVLVPPSLANELGLESIQTQVVLVASAPLTNRQIDEISGIGYAQGAADRLSFIDASSFTNSVSITVQGQGSPLATPLGVQLVALAVALVLVLVIGGCLIAVAATESDHDIATMVRVGAAPSLRRRFLAIQAGYHAVLGALLGVPIGLLLLMELRRALNDDVSLQMPWLSIATVLFAIPAVLAVAVGVAVRSRPPAAAVSLS